MTKTFQGNCHEKWGFQQIIPSFRIFSIASASYPRPERISSVWSPNFDAGMRISQGVSENFTGKDYWERVNILTDAIYEIFEPIEAVAMTPEEWERGNSDIREFAREGEEVKTV